MADGKKYYRIEAWAAWSWLVHGFGQAGFDLTGLKEEFPSFFPVEMRQQHSDRVVFLPEKPEAEIEADGLVTGTPGLLLLVKTADCLPVFLVDPVRRAVAAVHCGWRGTREKILLRALEVLRDRMGSRPHDILAAFGPCIEQSCYEVGREVHEQFRERGFRTGDIFRPAEQPDKFYLDLRRANYLLLTGEAGVPRANIYQIELCTSCQKNLHSYRRDKKNEARLFNFIGLS